MTNSAAPHDPIRLLHHAVEVRDFRLAELLSRSLARDRERAAFGRRVVGELMRRLNLVDGPP